MKRQVCSLCVALMVLPFGSVCAGDPDDPGRIYDPPQAYHAPMHRTMVGQYVRVNDGMNWEYGKVRSVRGDSLVLQQKSSDDREVLLVIPQSSVHYMQVRTGKDGHPGWGVLVGGIVGLFAGVAIGAGASEPQGGFVVMPEEPIAGGVIGTCLGMLVGGLIGSNIGTEQWRDISVNQLTTGTVPRPSGQLALGLTVQF